MRNGQRAILAALTTTAILALALSTASAGRLRVTEKNFELKWASLEFEAAGTVSRCPVTILGSFNEATIAKVVNGHIGHIRHAELGTCTGGTATILAETFPWEVSYQSFGGRLPAITSITFLLIGARFKAHPSGSAECLAGTTIEHPSGGIAAVSAGTVTSFGSDETRRFPLGGGFVCSLGGEAGFSGAASVTNLPGTASITVTLI